MTPSGIESATFRLVVQCLNRLWAFKAGYRVSFTFIASYYTDVHPKKGHEGPDRGGAEVLLYSFFKLGHR